MPDYSREELITELKRRRATPPLEMQPSHVPYSWETPEASLRRIEGIPEGYGSTEPWIDPASVFGVGVGSGVRAGLQAGKPLVSAGIQGLRSGLAGAAMDYPVGAVAGAVGEKYPYMALPVSVGLGIASGKYIEPKLEAGLRKLPEHAAEAAPYARMKLAEQRGSFSTKPVETETLYHGGYDIGPDMELKIGHATGKYTGQDAGAIFFTPSKKYAESYAKTPGAIYEYRLSPDEKIFDFSNKGHVRQFKKGFLEEWEENYSSQKDALRDYENAIKSLRETSRKGAVDWGTASQYIEQIEKAGFSGAKFLERPAEDIKILPDGSYELSGPPVLSYALFKDKVKVSKAREQQPQFTRSELVDELKRRRQTK